MTFESAENRYEIIKDEDKRSTERLNEFAEIFSCIYSQNEKLASDMWQYLVDKYSDISGGRFYVIRLLKIIQLDYKSTWKLLIMDKKRVEILFKHAYSNTNISFRAYEVISGYINSNMIEEAVMVIELVEKYEKRLSMLEGIKLIVVKIEQNITEDDVTLKERINLFYEKCMDKYQSNYFTTIFEIKLNLHNKLINKEKIKSCLEWIVESGICNAEYFSNDFVIDYCKMLYVNRFLLSDAELIYYVELFCKKYKKQCLSYRCTEEISNWIVEVSQKSSVLLNNLILNDYCFGNRYIQNLITTVNVQATEGISVDVKITFKLPKIIIRDGRCYNVEEKNIIFICNIIINICKNNGIYNELAIKAEHVKELYNINQITK